MFLLQEACFQRSDNHDGVFEDVHLSWRPSQLGCCTLFEKNTNGNCNWNSFLVMLDVNVK